MPLFKNSCVRFDMRDLKQTTHWWKSLFCDVWVFVKLSIASFSIAYGWPVCTIVGLMEDSG